MSASDTAKDVWLSIGSVNNRLDKIERLTSLNPRCFYDLILLVQFAKSDSVTEACFEDWI